eukprot:scaffold1104_cov299-Prasinococcus_capsulatus_cf.AAC.8
MLPPAIHPSVRPLSSRLPACPPGMTPERGGGRLARTTPTNGSSSIIEAPSPLTEAARLVQGRPPQ